MSRLDRGLDDKETRYAAPADGAVTAGAAHEVIQAELEFRRIIDTMIDTFYRTDLNGRLVLVSPSARQLLGWEPDDLIGQRLGDFYVDPHGREHFLESLRAGGGEVFNYEAVLRRKDGSEVWVETNDAVEKPISGSRIASSTCFFCTVRPSRAVSHFFR